MSKQKMRLTNSTGRPVELWMEPLGDMVIWPAQETIELTRSEPVESVIEEVKIEANRVTVFGWVDRIYIVVKGANPKLLWSSPPEPSTRR